MEWPIVGPIFGSVAMLLILSGTALLWPISRRLGHLLELVIQEKIRQANSAERLPTARLEEMLLRLEARLDHLEDEHRFIASLRDTGRAPAATLRTPVYDPAPLDARDQRAHSGGL
jgi:hypothetical protein